MLRDFESAPISEREKALFAFLDRVNRASNAVRSEQVQAVRDAGWSEEALYDAVTVCALFNFYNIWVDACGVQDMPADAYLLSGHRLATQGYAPDGGAPGMSSGKPGGPEAP